MQENHEYSEKLNSILNNLFHGVVLLDKDQNIVDFNKASLLLLKKSTSEFKSKQFNTLLPASYQVEFDSYFDNCKDDTIKNYGKLEIKLLHDDTGLKILEIDCNQTFISEDDNEIYSICLILDITQRRKLESELEKQKKTKEEILEKLEREQELNDMKSRFISIASHEFRTPLAGILSSVDLIQRYLEHNEEVWQNFKNKKKITSHIGKVKTSIKTLTTTLNQFLSLGKLEEGKIDYQEEEFDLEDTLTGFLSEFLGLVKPNQVIKYQHNTENNKVLLDRNILRNIINNLISNAIKYTPSGKNIYVASLVLEDEILISIRDEGMGIPDEDQKNLFKRFFRAKNVTNLQGTGLGLNIVKRYVTLMNGTITFESKENIGTIFKIKFSTLRDTKRSFKELAM